MSGLGVFLLTQNTSSSRGMRCRAPVAICRTVQHWLQCGAPAGQTAEMAASRACHGVQYRHPARPPRHLYASHRPAMKYPAAMGAGIAARAARPGSAQRC